MSEPVDLWLLSDLCTPWCIHVAVTLRIAEHIAAGTDKIADLADATKADAYVLHRMLEQLVGKGVFEEPEPGRFVLNDAARGLIDMRLGFDLNSIGGRFANGWSSLPTYVQTGASGYYEIFGQTFWEDLNANPQIGADFDALMGIAGHGVPNAEFEIARGWESIRTVVDVGGGSGAMLAEILKLRPQIRGTLVDFPRTVALAADTFRDAGVADRATVVGQSFFDPLPVGADLYILRKVINDWPDAEARQILTHCAEAARTQPGGRVVVLSSVNAARPKGISIEMMLVGGKHRDVAEFRELARQSGLEVVAAAKQPNYFVVECQCSQPPGEARP
jgi:hypothetical protein